ncbi:hypothetical protein ACFXPA_34835 [Amycolatopsis sp. NPDC059090]|uniref:hypothetical protein n=1 Tax=unclassified Amycolatopsis TaxID=2618356 RepID=UPI00366A5B9D
MIEVVRELPVQGWCADAPRRHRAVKALDGLVGPGERVRAACWGIVHLEALAVVLAATDRRLIGVGHYYATPDSGWVLTAGYGDVADVSPPNPPGTDRPLSLTVAGHRIRLTSPGPVAARFADAVRSAMQTEPPEDRNNRTPT